MNSEKLERLRDYIKTFGITYSSIANALNLDRSTVPKYFKGAVKMSESRFKSIINFLKVEAQGNSLKLHLLNTWLDFCEEDNVIVDELKILKEEQNKVILDFKRKECSIISKYASCIHEYGNVEYLPEKVNEEVWETKWQGVDCYPALVGYREVTKDRWARQCKKCSKVQYTYKRNKPIQEFEFDD